MSRETGAKFPPGLTTADDPCATPVELERASARNQIPCCVDVKCDRLAGALGNVGTIDPGAFDARGGLKSLPFPRPSGLRDGETWKVAVRVIDPRGNEGLRVLTEGGRWA